jgi:hypothetical protein
MAAQFLEQATNHLKYASTYFGSVELCCRSGHRSHETRENNFTSARGYHAQMPFAINASGRLSQGLRAEH